MKENYTKLFWAAVFSDVLAFVFSTYGFSDKSLHEAKGCDDSTVRKWLCGTRIPRQDNKEDLFNYLREQIPLKNTLDKSTLVKEYIETCLSERNLSIVRNLEINCGDDIAAFIVGILQLCINNSKAKHFYANDQFFIPTDLKSNAEKTKAVVFDFDGTLTTGNQNRTTWEGLWCSLGYDVSECRKLHTQFNEGIIDHATWCKLTEEKFIARNLHRAMVETIGDKITLIPGAEEVFRLLQENDVKIYIVSGSILHVIKRVLNNNLVYSYFDGIKANQFFFSQNGMLDRIVGTKYDFEGKAHFLSELSNELSISPSNILFVGNSINDEYAHISGVRTLCINPKLTNERNKTIWNDCIKKCNNLKEIIPYIRF